MRVDYFGEISLAGLGSFGASARPLVRKEVKLGPAPTREPKNFNIPKPPA